jgi:imidazolonepropionase-like amidohydrolase
MNKFYSVLALLGLTCSSIFAQKNYEFRNGNWFDGEKFNTATWYVTAGKFAKKAPAKIDSVIDLTGKWIVPPMADVASQSIIGSGQTAYQLNDYFRDGVFYIQVLSNTQEQLKTIQPLTGTANAPDVRFSNGIVTCSQGKSVQELEAAAMKIRNPNIVAQRKEEIAQSRKGLGDAYWLLDNKEAVAANWDKIARQKPDLVVIYLLDAANSGGKPGKGLTEEVAKTVVKKAHKSDLKVWAYVENMSDVQLALKLGIDGLFNLPAIEWDGVSESSKLPFSDADLKKIAKKGMAITPGFTQIQQKGNAISAATKLYHGQLMARMLAQGVNVVMGSNDPVRSLRSELNYWSTLEKVNYTALIKTLCETTPQAIYPNRKIGKIEQGYEASFLILSDNPLNNLQKLRVIDFKVKNGVIVK